MNSHSVRNPLSGNNRSLPGSSLLPGQVAPARHRPARTLVDHPMRSCSTFLHFSDRRYSRINGLIEPLSILWLHLPAPLHLLPFSWQLWRQGNPRGSHVGRRHVNKNGYRGGWRSFGPYTTRPNHTSPSPYNRLSTIRI